MNHRPLWNAVLTALAIGAAAPAPCAREAAPARNILFIAVDDLRPELGCYGHPLIKSPCIDRLAARGTLFEQAYCQQAVCAPSRASLLTGLRPDSTGIYDLDHPVRKTIPKVLSMPQHFRKHGYETVSLGKIYHHHDDDNGIGWTVDAWHPKGNWKGRGYLTPEAQKQIDTGPRKGAGVGPALEAAPVEDGEYPDGVTAEKAIEWLRKFKQEGKPFFLAVGILKPHLPFNAPQRYFDLYDPAKIRVSDQRAWPEGMPSCAGSNWGELKGYTDIPNGASRLEDGMSVRLIQAYFACVSYIDAMIGKVVDELDRLGLGESTAIILWGDHGWKLSEYGAWCKHTNFELDTHVPLILCAPGSGRGQRSKALVEYVDIFPTLSELCGLPVPESCEGTSMAPLLKDPAREWKAAAFSQYPRGKLMGYTMRSGPWRYTEWIDRKSGEVAHRELYDHAAGPVASRNVADDPRNAETVKRLSALLDKGRGWKKIQRP